MDFERVPRDVPDIVSGLRDPNSTLQARIVVDMADEIHLYDPEAAPFVTITKEFRDRRKTTQYKFDTLAKEPQPRALVLAADSVAADAVIDVATGQGVRTRAFDLLLNLRTREIVSVTSISSDAVTVTRAIGGSAVDMVTGDTLVIISNAHEDGARSGTAKSVKETSDYNYTQIIRRKYGWSGRQGETLMYGGSDIDSERKWQGIEHSKEIEYAMLFGKRHTMTGANGRLITMTGGIEFFLRSLVWDLNGIEPQQRAFEEFLEEGMRYGQGGFQNGNSTKYLFTSSRWITVINRWASDRLEYTTLDDTIGFRALKYKSPHGDIMIMKSVILDEYHADYGFLLDMNHVRYAYHQGRDTKQVKNREDNDLDGSEEEYISDIGLDMELEGSCAVLKGLPV